MKINQLSTVHPKLSKRLFVSFIDLIVVVFLAIALDFILVSPIIKNATDYNIIKQDYIILNEEYMKLQDEYGLYYYDSSSNRHLNEDATKEQIDLFLKDERVIELREIIPNLQDSLLKKDYLIIIIDYLIASFIFCLFGCFIGGIGVTPGHLLGRFRLKNDDLSSIKISRLFLYSFIKWIIFYILGLASIGVIPAIFYGNAYYKEDMNTPLERWFKLSYYCFEKDIGD